MFSVAISESLNIHRFWLNPSPACVVFADLKFDHRLMEDYEDDLERLAAAGLCGGRRSSGVRILRLPLIPSFLCKLESGPTII